MPARIELLPDGAKPCTRCSRILPASHFGKDKNATTGLRSACRDCVNATSRKRYQEDPTKYARQRAEWYAANKDKHRAWMAAHYAGHKADYAAYSAARRVRKMGAVSVPLRRGWRARLVDFYGGACLVPDCTAEDVAVDHVVPLAKGGAHAADNFQLLCRSHNSAKHTAVIDYLGGRIFPG